MEFTRIEGTNKGDVRIFTLSTCAWCNKTKRLLKELDVEYHYIDVDLLDFEEKKIVLQEIKKWNPRVSYPTIVINEEKVIPSFDETEIREFFENEKK